MLKPDNIRIGSKSPAQQDNSLSFEEKVRRCSEATHSGKAGRSELRHHFLAETEDGEGISLGEDELKSYLKSKKAVQCPKQPAYLIETEDGFLVRVPFDKLDSWAEAQHAPPHPSTAGENLVRNRIVTSLYGHGSGESHTVSSKSPSLTDPSVSAESTNASTTKVRRSTIMLWILSVALVFASTLALFFAFRSSSLESSLSIAMSDLDQSISKYQAVTDFRDQLLDTVNRYSDEINFWRSNVVITTEFGEKYHTYGCQYIKNSNILRFMNVGVARLRGYEACSVCSPAISPY